MSKNRITPPPSENILKDSCLHCTQYLSVVRYILRYVLHFIL